jgi:ferric-dicitrate binding protein FerR (iron transport regulator)
VRPLSLTLPLLLLLWACDCGKPPPAAAPALARLTQVQGDVSVLRAAERRAARVNEPLAAGETLVTGPGSAARVRYVNGAEVQVGENSRFRVSGAPGSLTLELEEGRVISTAPKSATTGLTVVGRFGRAELVTAAEMVFDLREESPRLTLEYGEIRVLDPEGKPVQMVQGEELDFSLRKPAPPLVQGEEIVFFLEPRGGKARVRGAQQADFAEVSPEQRRELKPGSAFEVPAQATARLRS